MAHKKRKSKYLSVMFVSENKQAPKNFRLRTGLLKLATFLGILLVALIVFGFLTYWKVASVALDYNRLEEENFKLVQSLNQMDKIKEQLSVVQGFEKKLKSTLGGYLTIEQSTKRDSISENKFDFAKMSGDQRRTFFRNIPSLQPTEGFWSRGFDASLMLTEPHIGMDISAPTGTPVKAPADGVVMFAGWTVEGGNILIVEHGFGFLTIYKHNERNLVQRMDKVTQGQIIALVGNTGKISSGPHLHYEVWKNGKPVDPAGYMNRNEKS